jgi:hypothetical protein
MKGNKMTDKLINDLIDVKLQAFRTMFDVHVHTELLDIDAEGNPVNNSIASFTYLMNGIIPSYQNQVLYADKMLNYVENAIKWEKQKMGASSRLSSLDLYARSQEIAHNKLNDLEKQFQAREHNFNHAFANYKAICIYFEEVTGDEYKPFDSSKSVKYLPSEERQNKVKTIKAKQKQELAKFYNDTMGKLQKPLDNEDGTISPEVIPAV